MLTEDRVFGNQIGTQMHGRLVKMCCVCGALVADTAQHVLWHNREDAHGD